MTASSLHSGPSVWVLMAFISGSAAWMNGDYEIANQPAGQKHESFRGEYIDVYSHPISTRYSEVYWTMQPPIPLPSDFVARYKDKIAAFTGYEVDSVRTDASGNEESVPLYEQYNHHHGAYVYGAAAEMVHMGAITPHHMRNHGGSYSNNWEPRDKPSMSNAKDNPAIPTAWFVVDGNGGEYRKSLHSVGKGFASLVESPTTFQVQPMMINTKNPDGKGPGGPLPKGVGGWKGSRAPPNASYSGLLECPCTDRKNKAITAFETKARGGCEDDKGFRKAASAEDCFTAAANLGLSPVSYNSTVHTSSAPAACYVVATQSGFEVYYNDDATSTAQCGPSAKPQHIRSLGERKTPEANLHLDLDTACGNATITVSGQDGKWFGIGFGAQSMADQPYAIVVDGEGKVTEHKLGNHEAGSLLKESISVTSNTVTDGVRTVVLKRPLAGATRQHYTFDPSSSGIMFISAAGNGPDFAYHKSRSGSSLILVEVGSPLCICAGGKGGSIDGVPFSHKCQPQPTSDLLVQQNPTCDISTYNGGLLCCSHKSVLLDSDQEIPPEVDTYRMKFRLYYEDYSNQRNAFFMFWTNEQGAGEYDIPQCLPGMSAETCKAMGIVDGVHTTTSVFKVRDSMRHSNRRSDPWGAPGWNESSDVLLLRAGQHCHAPACISEELYNEDTGELLCRNVPLVGSSLAPFDETDYVPGIPPCLWGEASDGLSPPPRLKLDTKLRSIKRANATYYHYGVMAQWQMRGAFDHAASSIKDDAHLSHARDSTDPLAELTKWLPELPDAPSSASAFQLGCLVFVVLSIQ